MAVHVYVGPTLPSEEVTALLPGAILHGPARHGDLLADDIGHGDRVLLVDGSYHQTGSVRHKEILYLLDAGATVVGCSSMGALRAAELHPMGMVGVGEVFNLYRRQVIVSDDEVAVAHTEEPDYRRLSEPLVNIRRALRLATEQGLIDSTLARAALEHARALPYTSRSWAAIETVTGPSLRAVRDAADIKAQDARAALALVARVTPPAETLAWRATRDWQTRQLWDWKARFRGQMIEDIHINELALACYEQIHDATFPSRWRRHVLTRIAGTTDPAQAVRVAAGGGLTLDGLDHRQVASWLSASERRELSPDEAMTRILVRSYRSPRGLYDLVDESSRLIADRAASRVAVAESYATNEVVAEQSPHWLVDNLDHELLATGLAALWEVPTDDRDYAACDRGIESFTEAVERFRPFFLRHYLATEL